MTNAIQNHLEDLDRMILEVEEYGNDLSALRQQLDSLKDEQINSLTEQRDNLQAQVLRLITALGKHHTYDELTAIINGESVEDY